MRRHGKQQRIIDVLQRGRSSARSIMIELGLAGAALGEEVAAPVAGALVRGHGGAVLAGGGALGQQVVAGVHARPAGARGAASLLLRGARAHACTARVCIRRQVSLVEICSIEVARDRERLHTVGFLHGGRDQDGLEDQERQQSARAALHLLFRCCLLPTLKL